MTMKIITIQVFVTLGVVFLVLLGLYLLMADPFGWQSSAGATAATQSSSAAVGDAATTGDGNGATAESATTGGFALSGAQVDALVSLGIDPDSVPATVSAEQEACFTDILGAERVAEIKAGAVPSSIEFFRAKSCI